jgi:hypothetical protein
MPAPAELTPFSTGRHFPAGLQHESAIRLLALIVAHPGASIRDLYLMYAERHVPARSRAAILYNVTQMRDLGYVRGERVSVGDTGGQRLYYTLTPGGARVLRALGDRAFGLVVAGWPTDEKTRALTRYEEAVRSLALLDADEEE